MACRLSKEKAAGIAAEYCTNGFKKVESLLSIGYSKTYANNVGLKLFDNDLVLRAIAKIQAVAITITGYSLEQAQAEYEQARAQAIQLKQPAAAVSAITGKARLHGMDKDAGSKGKDDIASAIDEALQAELQAVAQRYKLRKANERA